jgi:hypothetical protein
MFLGFQQLSELRMTASVCALLLFVIVHLLARKEIRD